MAPTVAGYLNAGVAWSDLSDYVASEAALKLGLSRAERFGSREFRADILNDLGAIKREQGLLDDALKYANDARVAAEKSKDKISVAIAFQNLGNIAADKGGLKHAEEYQQQALTIFQNYNYLEGQAQTLTNMGTIRSGTDLEAALTYHRQASDLYKSVGNSLGEAKVLNNLGNTYADKGQLKMALSSYNNAMTEAQKSGNRMLQAKLLNNIGDVEREIGENLDSAFRSANEALNLFTELGSSTDKDRR